VREMASKAESIEEFQTMLEQWVSFKHRS
jgi:hypothetical protein